MHNWKSIVVICVKLSPGIDLDPQSLKMVVNEIYKTVIEYTGVDLDTEYEYHVFISYRVDSDADVAEKLCDKLKLEGLKVFFDKNALKSGMPWKEGFMQGLQRSKCFLSLISDGALIRCRNKTIDHSGDNYMLEMETAANFQRSDEKYKGFIVPVLIGAYDENHALRKFRSFDTTLYANSVGPEVEVEVKNASESKNISHLHTFV